VQNNTDAATTQKLIDYLFDHQEQFTEELLLDYTLDNFLDQLAALVASVTVSSLSFRKSTKRPFEQPSKAKLPVITLLATTGNTQLELTEFQAPLSSTQMESESTEPKNGALTNGLPSSKNTSDPCLIHDHI
jgi:hypothetical protein